jgi:hypothetical protein
MLWFEKGLLPVLCSVHVTEVEKIIEVISWSAASQVPAILHNIRGELPDPYPDVRMGADMPQWAFCRPHKEQVD